MINLQDFSLKQLQYFAAVAEFGSFRQAAFRLEITQPTLSNQVAIMEKALKVQLFERTRKGINTTPQGRELLLSARRVLEEAQGFTTQAALLSGGGIGTYRLGVTPTLGPYLLPHILKPIHDTHSDLKLYVRENPPSELETGLINGQHDLILTTLPIMSGELIVVNLFREPLKLALAKDHRLANRTRIKREDLLGEPVLTISEHHLFHRQITELCEEVGAPVLRDYEGTSLDTLRQMVGGEGGTGGTHRVRFSEKSGALSRQVQRRLTRPRQPSNRRDSRRKPRENIATAGFLPLRACRQLSGTILFRIDPAVGYIKSLLRKFLLFQVRGFRIPRERGFVRRSGRVHRLEAKRNLRLGRGHA